MRRNRMDPYVLWGTSATHYMANGSNPVTLAVILAHSSPNQVMTYAHLDDMLRDEGTKRRGYTHNTRQAYLYRDRRDV